MKEITESDALSRLSAFCAAAEHCRAEVTEKMQRWGLPYEAVQRIADRLETEGFVNEERFARAFITDKYRFAKWGKVKIAHALQLKKIPAYTYRPLLAEVDEEEYLDILRALLRAKQKSVHAGSEYERNGKLVRFALSRGFEMDDIRRCIEVADDDVECELEENDAIE